MNKLISRNPILRFKLGRKIVKAQFSWGKDFGRIDLGVNTPTIDYQIPSIEIPREQIESLPSVPVARASYPYRGSIVRLGIQENPDISPSISLDSYLILGSTKGGQLRVADEALVQKMANEYLQQLAANETLNLEEQPKLTVTKKTRVVRQLNTPKFYGLTVGGKVLARGSNFNGLINDSLKQALLNAGFKNEDFVDVRSFLNALNNFFLKDGAGSIKADNMWGDQTQKAFNMALSKAGYDPSNKMALTPTTISNIYNLDRLKGLYATGLLKKPENPTIVPEGGISNFKPLSTAKTYNRAGIRDYIRSKGFNPYDYAGYQRKALRMVMNGQGTDEDKAIVKAMGIFKLGGILPSRNIVKRFKQGGILKFLTAGNLPTAPKAEKRYRKSSSNTTKKGNRETTTITSQTFGYNRNWPYFRQPATILRIIEDRDTAFVETPEHHIFTKVLPRTALKSGNTYFEYNPKYDENFSLHGQANTLANYPVTSLEYEILKRRFNTAWNLAK